MSNFVEKIGKTVDEAVKMALQELNTTEENNFVKQTKRLV